MSTYHTQVKSGAWTFTLAIVAAAFESQHQHKRLREVSGILAANSKAENCQSGLSFFSRKCVWQILMLLKSRLHWTRNTHSFKGCGNSCQNNWLYTMRNIRTTPLHNLVHDLFMVIKQKLNQKSTSGPSWPSPFAFALWVSWRACRWPWKSPAGSWGRRTRVPSFSYLRKNYQDW